MRRWWQANGKCAKAWACREVVPMTLAFAVRHTASRLGVFDLPLRSARFLTYAVLSFLLLIGLDFILFRFVTRVFVVSKDSWAGGSGRQTRPALDA